MEEKLQAKAVQEISESNKISEIPEKFVHKNGYPQSKVDSVPYMDDFVIDFSLLTSSSPQSDFELAKLQLALSQWGCFQAINHGLTNEFLDKLRQVGKEFFALPPEEKRKYSREINDWDGYGNDTIVSEDQTLDWMDRLYLTVNPQDRRKLKFWPDKPHQLREIIHEYTMKVKVMFEQLLKAMARSLNLEENSFKKEHGDLVAMFARFNFYPPCPIPENVLGIKPHADGVTITVLLQDKEVEGLQVQKDDQWFKVPIVPYALFINVGDMLEIMSNGILKSPVHRVVTNSERERMTLAMFCYTDFEREMGPLAELITEERPQMYKRVKHYEKIFFKNYQVGKRPLHSLKMY